jgi:hypothetical protein
MLLDEAVYTERIDNWETLVINKKHSTNTKPITKLQSIKYITLQLQLNQLNRRKKGW